MRGAARRKIGLYALVHHVFVAEQHRVDKFGGVFAHVCAQLVRYGKPDLVEHVVLRAHDLEIRLVFEGDSIDLIELPLRQRGRGEAVAVVGQRPERLGDKSDHVALFEFAFARHPQQQTALAVELYAVGDYVVDRQPIRRVDRPVQLDRAARTYPCGHDDVFAVKCAALQDLDVRKRAHDPEHRSDRHACEKRRRTLSFEQKTCDDRRSRHDCRNRRNDRRICQ